MAYNEARKKATIKYVKSLKRIDLRYTRKEYENLVEPAVESSGMPATTFVRTAVREKISRDYPDLIRKYTEK